MREFFFRFIYEINKISIYLTDFKDINHLVDYFDQFNYNLSKAFFID